MIKQCCLCKELKPLSDFYADKRASDGKRSECRLCFKATGRGLWRHQHPDRYREKQAEWQKRNPELSKEIKRRYRARHPDQATAQRKEWRAANPEKRRAHDRLHKAVRSGKIVRPDTCSTCGAGGPIDGHHTDYSKPYDVIWLCRKCHAGATQETLK